MAFQKQRPLRLSSVLLLLLLAAASAAEMWNFNDPQGGQESSDVGLAGGVDFGGLDDATDFSFDQTDESSFTEQTEFSEQGIGSGFEDDGFGFEDDGFGFEDDGFSFEDEFGYENDGFGIEEGKYGYEDDGVGFEDGGYGYGDGGYGYGYEDGGYGYEDGDYGYENGGYGYEDGGYGYEDGGYGYEDGGYGYENGGYGYEDGGYGYEDGGYGYEDGGYGYEDGGYGYEDGGYGYEDGGYGYEDGGYGYEDGGYGYEDGGYGYEDGGYGYEDGGYGYEDGGYGRRYRGGRRGRGGRRAGMPVQVRSAGSDSGMTEIEFEDGSVSADEIPAGYFGQEEQNARPMPGNQPQARVVTGGIDMPGFRLIIGDALQWWKHDINVCLHKENLRPREFEDADSHLTMYSLRCGRNSVSEYSCLVNQWNGSDATSQRLTYTCCSGFTRLAGDRGCPRRVFDSSTSNRTFAALLQDRGYSQRAIELFSAVLNSSNTRRQLTVFVPAKQALETAISSFEEVTRTEEAGTLVRKVLVHFAKPALSTQSLRNGQLLATLAKPSSLLVSKTRRGSVLVNCQPLVQPNQAFNRYSLAHFTTGVLKFNKLNLYQLMLRQLENVTTPDTAKRLLAPLKSTLTGSRPMTVFMHLPATDEIDNGCYARNLRAAIVRGVECNASMASVSALRTIEGKLVRVQLQRSSDGSASLLIDGNRLVEDADQLASNGVLHLARTTESLTGFANEATRRLKAAAEFRPLFARPNRTEADLVLLLPPINGSYSYENTSARWANATELASFGRRHLLTNATCLRGASSRLTMLDGARRDFVQMLQRTGASIFSPGRLVRRRFVDCVQVTRIAKDCGGTAYFLLRGELPNFNSSSTAMDYLDARDSYSMTKTILSFGLRNNISGLDATFRRQDASILLVRDTDMVKLSGRLLLRRRRPTREQMTELAQWFTRYFVAARSVCSAKQLVPSLRVPVFRVDLRPCRSVVCAMRRRMYRRTKLVQLQPGSHVTIREGFLLPGRVAR
ncbi:hypothetical protein BOX15_Mlig008047g1 [Macrostomum lignano]|uniref:FAS1 domain-containing protein n=2 Tax=Macrostomum lignano TaxID=282301 RepID=A0A267FWV1_9PLAT|nr:hypothetical protein BOX15_Mlig008047g1 [Macrostomum lignano]